MRHGAHLTDGATGLAEHLDLLGREIRSGSSLRVAVDLHGDPRVDSVAGGASPADRRIADHALELARRRAGSEAVCLHHAAAALRERAALAHEARAHSAAAWASARLLTIVPTVFATWGLSTSAALRAALSTAAGLGCALGGTFLNVSGWLWMRRIVGGTSR